MAVLEELGYLEQPHTSAGRVPTFNGYRMYIEEISAEGTLPKRNGTGWTRCWAMRVS